MFPIFLKGFRLPRFSLFRSFFRLVPLSLFQPAFETRRFFYLVILSIEIISANLVVCNGQILTPVNTSEVHLHGPALLQEWDPCVYLEAVGDLLP